MSRLLLALTLASTLVACGGSDAPSSATIAITSPTVGQSVSRGSDQHMTVDVAFAVTGFTFQPCPSDTSGSCGHVHLLIDGFDCGQPYNNFAVASPAQAFFDKCSRPTGAHTITLELHHTDHTAIKNTAGAQIASAVSFTTL